MGPVQKAGVGVSVIVGVILVIHVLLAHPFGQSWDIQTPPEEQVCCCVPEHCVFPGVHPGVGVGHTQVVSTQDAVRLLEHAFTGGRHDGVPLGAVPNVQHP